MKGSVYALPLTQVDVSTLQPGIYKEIETEDKVHSLVKLHIQNSSNVSVFLSFDGYHDHDIIAPGKDLHLHISQTNQGFNYPKYFIRTSQKGEGICSIATYYLNIGV